MELEKRGVRTVVVGTDRFKRLGDVERKSLGMPDLTLAIAEHHLGGLQPQTLLTKVDGLLDQGVEGLIGGR